MTDIIDTAFIVAAGKGTRMAPLTDHTPKPLVPLAGRPILDYMLDHLRGTDVRKLTMNTHHLAEKMRDYLANIQDFEVIESYEAELLETGGGLQKAIPTLGHKPIFMINGDAFWTDGPSGNVLQQMVQQFDAAKMDILLLLIPVANMKLTQGVGDYDIAADGQALRRADKSGQYMFTGIRILNPAIMADVPAGKYSFLQQMDAAEAKGLLHARIFDGEWHHISTQSDAAAITQYLQKAAS
jgi:MurNAc alpha-1-phosphate uridylyltransferase